MGGMAELDVRVEAGLLKLNGGGATPLHGDQLLGHRPAHAADVDDLHWNPREIFLGNSL